jgi:hypothetical protein
MEAASPDLEKQGFFAVVFLNREYSVQPDPAGAKIYLEIKMLYSGVTPTQAIAN